MLDSSRIVQFEVPSFTIAINPTNQRIHRGHHRISYLLLLASLHLILAKETFAMPGDECFRFHEDESGAPVGPDARQPCLEKSVRGRSADLQVSKPISPCIG
jgi:hypothetical protein